jgi:hypothetical protein
MKSVLDRTMIRYQKALPQKIESLQKSYFESFEFLVQLFQDDVFIIPTTGRISRPLYDGLMVAHFVGKQNSHAKPNIQSEAQARLKKLLANEENYKTVIGRGNTTDSVIERVNLLTKVLFT